MKFFLAVFNCFHAVNIILLLFFCRNISRENNRLFMSNTRKTCPEGDKTPENVRSLRVLRLYMHIYNKHGDKTVITSNTGSRVKALVSGDAGQPRDVGCQTFRNNAVGRSADERFLAGRFDYRPERRVRVVHERLRGTHTYTYTTRTYIRTFAAYFTRDLRKTFSPLPKSVSPVCRSNMSPARRTGRRDSPSARRSPPI